MLSRGTALLTAARAEGWAIGAFTTYTLESTRAVCLAAERTGRPVIIQAGSSSFGGVRRDLLAAGAPSDPHLAAQFAARTGVAALAVAVGNVHGLTSTPIRLDLERLREIARLTPVPLVLHGASGLLEEDLTGAIDAGVCKVNFNAE